MPSLDLGHSQDQGSEPTQQQQQNNFQLFPMKTPVGSQFAGGNSNPGNQFLDGYKPAFFTQVDTSSTNIIRNVSSSPEVDISRARLP